MKGWIQLPYPPSVNTYYRTFKGRILISAPGRAYRQLILSTIGHLTRMDKIIECTPIGFDIFMHVLVYPPDKRRRDLDNILKALLDALQHGGLYKDDSQISKLVIERKEVVKSGSVFVMIDKI